MSEDLNPCPFCGGKLLKVWDNAVGCKTCGAHGPDLGHCVGEECRKEAIADWNHRSGRDSWIAG